MLGQYSRINQAAGINIIIQQEGTVLINACGISANGKQLDIDQKITDLQSLKQLNQYLPAKTFVALNVVGKGVLFRQVEKAAEITQSNFNLVLPNANAVDFYIQNFISGEYSFVSVIRKREADRWIEQVKEAGYIPLSLSLGPFAIDHVLEQLNFYGNEVQFDGHEIKLTEDKHWKSYLNAPDKLATFPLKIENEPINEKVLIPYATAFQLILSSRLDPIQAQVDTLQTNLKKQLDQIKLKAQGLLILGIFFILLLINFIAFSSLNANNNKLEEQVSRITQSSTDIAQLSEQIKQKESLLQLLGWEGAVNKSALIDQLAALLPAEVKWSSVEVNPLDLSASRIEKVPKFHNRRIRITGESEKIIPVNEWIARIKTKKWVKDIRLDSYTFSSELNTGIFTINLDY